MSRDPPPPPPTTAGSAAYAAASKMCQNCYADDHWIVHNVKHRGQFKKLCTSCVLKLHPVSFCPTCFSLHDPNSLNPIPSSSSSISGAGKTLTCFKCSSLSHSTCVPPNVPKSPYLCPPCSNPNFIFFDIRKSKNDQNLPDGGDGSNSKAREDGKKALDERAAKVLLAAARIASISMNKAAAVARENAERRVKDAALARKRAKESIDHVMALSARFASNKRREIPSAAAGAPVPAPIPVSAKTPNGVPVKIEKNNNGNQLKAEY